MATGAKYLVGFFGLLCAIQLNAQNLWIPLGSKDYEALDRLEIKLQRDSSLNFSKFRPFTACKSVEDIARTTENTASLSAVDRYNLSSLAMQYPWVQSDSIRYRSLSGGAGRQGPLSLLNLRGQRNYISVLPLAMAQVSRENGSEAAPYVLSGGARAEAILAAKISFYGAALRSWERPAAYQRNWINRYVGLPALPGEGRFSATGDSSRLQYWDFRGGMSFKITHYIDATLAYDKNFIGNGYRSFVISDYSSPYLFFRLNTRIWKFNYENLYARLTPQSNRDSAEAGLKKFLVLHHLDIDVTRWLNLGVFEAVVMGRADHIDFNYLPPVLFIKGVEYKINSPDKVNLGFDWKANLAHHFQLYGQFVLNEFVLSEMIHQSRGWWGNKYAYQAGLKYIDVAGIRNLDLQLESNRARPYTFEHFTLTANFSNYNQPLLHPLGANFQEYIAIVRYQPLPRLRFEGKVIHYRQGLDTSGVNMGSNVMTDYTTRPGEYGFQLGAGRRAVCTYSSFLLSFEPWQRFFIDLSFTARSYRLSGADASSTQMGSIGLRLNLARREYDY